MAPKDNEKYRELALTQEIQVSKEQELLEEI